MSLRDATRAVAADALRDSPHPEPEVLVAYATNDLDDESTETVRWHLALCATCADVVLDAGRFPNLALPEPLDDDALEAQWARFEADTRPNRQRAAMKRGAVTAAQPHPRAPSPWQATPVPMRYAVAALMALTIGLSILLGAVWPAAEVPRTGLVVARIAVDPARGEAEATRIALDDATEGVLLIINAPAVGDPDQRFTVEIVEADGEQLLWRQEGLRRQPGGYLLVALPPTFLPAGRYRIRLLDGDGVVGGGDLRIVATD